MKTEYDTLMRNQTWILVSRPHDKKVLTNRWVFKTKRDLHGQVYKYKARLVVRRYVQIEGIDFQELYVPVARYESIRTLFVAAVNEEINIIWT